MRHLLTLLAALAAMAAPPTSPIRDTVYKADGTPLAAVVVISWPSFLAADGTSVPMGSITLPLVQGVLAARLVPTTTALTAVQYTARYVADGKTQLLETWMVPPSAVPLRIADIKITVPTDPLPAVLEMTDVQGLVEALAMRVLKSGAGYSAGKVAVIDEFGELAGVAGPAGECVRADGSTIACPPADLMGQIEARPVKAAGYVPGRVVMTDANGALAPVPGSITDCVHPDGTTGPCGVDWSNEIAMRAVMAVDYTPNRAARVNVAGEISSVIGEDTDCVRADGSASPCTASLPDTDSLPEGSAHLYFSAARARAALSATGGLCTYSQATGVLDCPAIATGVRSWVSPDFTAQTTLVFSHGLNSTNIATVSCRDETGARVETDTDIVLSANQVRVTFATPQSGRCIVLRAE